MKIKRAMMILALLMVVACKSKKEALENTDERTGIAPGTDELIEHTVSTRPSSEIAMGRYIPRKTEVSYRVLFAVFGPVIIILITVIIKSVKDGRANNKN